MSRWVLQYLRQVLTYSSLLSFDLDTMRNQKIFRKYLEIRCQISYFVQTSGCIVHERHSNMHGYTKVVLENLDVPVVIDNQTYYRTAEVCRKLGISRNTLFRWLQKGVLGNIEYRDWRGWRLFTAAQVQIMMTRTNRITARSLEKRAGRE